jgi:hypothetical protein
MTIVMYVIAFLSIAFGIFLLGCACGQRAQKRIQARRVVERVNRDLQEKEDSERCKNRLSKSCAECEFLAECDVVGSSEDAVH